MVQSELAKVDRQGLVTDVDCKPYFLLVHGLVKLILLIKLSIFSYLNSIHAYIGMFIHVYTWCQTQIIVGDLVCRTWLTHRGSGHQFLDDLSLLFTTLDESDTPSVGL